MEFNNNISRNIVVLAISMIISLHPLKAQNTQEWFKQKKTQRKYLVEQIAALQVYLKYLKKGYRIVDRGLTMVGDIRDGKFTLDKSFIQSLSNVNPAILRSTKVTAITAYGIQSRRSLQRLKKETNNDPMLTPDERRYLRAVEGGLAAELDNIDSDLNLLTKGGYLEMTDNERMLKLNEIFNRSWSIYSFSNALLNSTAVLVQNRIRENNEIKNTQQLITE